jgi:ABC-type sugar transport system permease subunit
VLNAFLELIGLPAMQTAWLGNMTTTLPALIAVSIWKDWGFSMIIFLSGLQTIPEELYEAAEIDGASSWQQFFNVTLPLLRSVGIVALIFCVINSFKLFTLVFIMTAGGPLHQSETLSTWIYKNGFQYGNLGYAAAMSFILFGIILIVTILQMKILKGDE